MNSRLVLIVIFFLFFLIAIPVYASPDDATWQKTIDATGVWWGLPTGDIWTFVRFYPYGDEQFTIKLWRHNNPDDLSALKFDSGTMYWWWKTNSSWVTIGQYPEDECWLETAIHHTTAQLFYLRYAETDVTLYFDLDLQDICPDAYGELYDLSFGNSQWQGLEDYFEYELKFYGGSVAFDYTEGGSSQILFFYPIDLHVSEDFEDDVYDNWDSSSITCTSAYVTIGDMTVGKFWITGSEPSTPPSEDVEKPWWENIREQFMDTLSRMWTNARKQLTNIPVIGGFIDALWGFLDWSYGLLSAVWMIVVANLPVILTMITLGYFFRIVLAIKSGDFNGITDSIRVPINDARGFITTITGVVGTIWNFLKFW